MKNQTIEQAVEEFKAKQTLVEPDGFLADVGEDYEAVDFNMEVMEVWLREALQAQRDAGEVRLKTFAENVIEVDKTERYEYSKNDCDRNAKGELAGSGARWSTPKEMAQRILQALTPPTK